jgi:hypothetical protein
VGLLVLGWLIGLAGGILLIVAGFRHSPVWGLVVLLVPFGALVFLVKFWPRGKTALMVQILGLLVSGMGVAAGYSSGMRSPEAVLKTLGISDISSLRPSAGGHGDGSTSRTGSGKGEPELVGQPIAAMTELLGQPHAKVKKGQRVTFFYPERDIAVESDDGQTVSRTVPLPPEVSPAPRQGK